MIVQSSPTISIRLRGARRRGEVVVAGDHVAPPGFLDVPLQLDAERAVVPEAVEAAVDLARLKRNPRRLHSETSLSMSMVHHSSYAYSIHHREHREESM